jgi:uncharacterized peroxidase-related enzyme
VFIDEPDSPEARAAIEKERAASGFVMNADRLWSWRPDVADGFTALRKTLTDRTTLTPREVAVLVCAAVRSLGDSYCSLAWGKRLAAAASPALAADVLRESDSAEMTARERALALWARRVARDPNAASAAEVGALRAAGFSDREIFEATAWIAFRLALATVNDALGARPDAQVAAEAPPEVRAAVTYGRPVAGD